MVKGLIYKCECLKTNKYYIGQTTRSLELRKKQHIQNSLSNKAWDYNCAFHQAIREFGEDCFKWSVVVQIQAENETDLAESLNELEWYYIKKFNSFIDGYNMSRGGDGNRIKPARVIAAYDVTGEKLKEFDSIDDAAHEMQIHNSTIKLVLNHQQPFIKKSYDRYVFRYDGDSYTQEEINQNLEILSREIIHVFNVQGQLVDSCLNLGQFCKKYDIRVRAARQCVCGQSLYVLSNKYVMPLFIFKGKQPDCMKIRELIEIYSNPINRTNFCLKVKNLVDNTEKLYASLVSAAKDLNVNYRELQRPLGEFKRKEIIIGCYHIINLKYYDS